MNKVCQELYTKSGPVVNVWNDEFDEYVSTGFYLNDPVMCTVNRWDMGVLNGSVGKIVSIEKEAKPIYKDGVLVDHSIADIEWDDGETRLQFEKMLDDFELSYAMTIHKSQGSQWPNVIVALTRNKLLDRTLVYTAMTRTRAKVTLIGDIDAARSAVMAAPRHAARQVALGRILSDMLANATP